MEIVDDCDTAMTMAHADGDIITGTYLFGEMVRSAPADIDGMWRTPADTC